MKNNSKDCALLTNIKHPFLEKFSERFLIAASENARELEFNVNEIIFSRGERAEKFYLVMEGKIGLEIDAPDHPSVRVHTVDSNKVMGWSWLVPPYKWTVTARALKKTRVIALDAFVLHRYFKLHPEDGYLFCLRLLPVIAERLDETRLQLINLFDRYGD
ncbi:MAG: Crp/Fnr family transcriptional regulator [Thermoplasmata archaeon]